MTTLNSNVSTTLLVSRVTQSGLPERASNFQPTGPFLIHGCNTLQKQGSLAPISCASLIKNRSESESGPSTTSVDPLCHPEHVLLIKFPGFWKFQCHSWHHKTASCLHLYFLVTIAVLSNDLIYLARQSFIVC